MSRYDFELAAPADDPLLRLRMAEDVMEGEIGLSLRREPDYFRGCKIQGEQWQVIKCTESGTGRIVGLGSRLALRAFVNGLPTRIGYMADLRAAVSVRRSTLLARGYRYLAELHAADPLPFYYAVILEGNLAAVQALTCGRAGLPVHRPYGRILTSALHLDLPKAALPARGLRLEPARPEQLPAVFEFINRQLARRQLAPCYRPQELGHGRLYGLRAEDIYLAIRGNRIVGTLAAWDQSACRQTYVERYSRRLRLLRPFYNAIARVSPLKALPPPGSPVPYFFLALSAVADDDLDVYRALVRHVYRERRRGRWHYCVAGLHEQDPLRPALSDYRGIPAHGQLYLVHYPQQPNPLNYLDERVPYVEVAAL